MYGEERDTRIKEFQGCSSRSVAERVQELKLWEGSEVLKGVPLRPLPLIQKMKGLGAART